ncbi:hypothetical protein SynRS9907_00924 [Synechococcus sp. RS9907]|nr:hypothetical protein SynRS9907_00924 [Synechococcus sp. RS9907]
MILKNIPLKFILSAQSPSRLTGTTSYQKGRRYFRQNKSRATNNLKQKDKNTWPSPMTLNSKTFHHSGFLTLKSNIFAF